MKTLQDLDYKNKKVLLRLNLNVPIEKGVIQDYFRIKTVIPTIETLAKDAGKVVIIAHLGRPKGKRDCNLSLQPVANALADMLSQPVTFLDNVLGEKILTEIDAAPKGSIFLLENLRFHEEEMKNDEFFGKQLARLGDVYVNDAFGDSAKETASIMQPPKHLPSALGLRFQDEIADLDKLKEEVKHPFVLIVGGAKIKEKLGVLEELGKKADQILLGGGVANTIFAAGGADVKASLVQKEEIPFAKMFMEEFKDKIILPHDVLVAKKIGDGFDQETIMIKQVDKLLDGEAILDIGPGSIKRFSQIINDSESTFWAGPLGYFEWKPSSKGSYEIAKVVAAHAGFDAIGGGETASLFDLAGVRDQVDFISTGGSASLKYLSNKNLPGLEALK